MPGEDDPLQELAAAISDGRAVEWGTLEASGNAATDPIIREFRVLATLAELHRRSQASDHDQDPESLDVSPVSESIGTWGPFELRAVVGRGSFGTVYRARDPKLDRDVALKLVPAAEPSAAERVVAEGRRLARVRHTNVITVFGADVFDGVAGIWMELLEGQTLHQELQERGPLGAREAALVGIDLCQALAAVHQAGLVHRDVKAQNVMRQEGGRIVLMDFGTGRDLTKPGTQGGTPLYMAPELLTGGSASAASDIYSLGVMLFRLVTGEFPVTGTTIEDLKRAHESNNRRKLRDVRPDLPSSFIRAVERAIAPDTAGRPASAAAFEDELEAVVLHRDPPDKHGKQRSWRVSRFSMAALIVAFSLVAFSVPAVWRAIAPGPRGIRSIAVLPFANLTGSPDQEYLADGLTQLLIDNLAQIESLKVISRTSAMAYKTSHKPLSTIASELKIDGILEGSIGRSGDRIRVTVRLVRPNEEHVWGQMYERPAADVFRVQGDISAMVAEAVSVSLTDQERRSLIDSPGVEGQAQDAFLRGLQRLNDQRVESLKLALEDLTEAVRLDPTSARAYAALSQCYVLLVSSEVLSQEEAYGKALAAATRAIQLYDGVAEAHTQLAEVKFYYEWNWDAAQREYERALELNPNNSHALARYSLFLSALGRSDEAIRMATRAQERDPFSPTIRYAPGMALYYARRYADAVAAFERLTQLPPYSLLPTDRVGLARAYSAVGRHAEAIEQLQATVKQLGARAAWVAEIGRIQAASGNLDEGRRILNELRAKQAPSRRPANLAFLSIAAGDTDAAFAELEQAAQVRAPVLLWANVDPRFDSVRNDKRFHDLVGRIGLPLRQE